MKPFVFAIRAEYVARILDGSKRWEFRTRCPSVALGDTALIYESRGRGRIVGAFTVGGLVHWMEPGQLWRAVEAMTPGGHGIPRADYDRYFEDRDKAVAIEVEGPIALDLELPPTMSPPQSWVRWRGAWPLGGES